MDFIAKNIWFILFFVWGMPLSYYRSKFRKIIYQTDSWVINIKPVFWKEIKGLFGNIYPDNLEYKKFRNFYLFYLGVYLVLFIAFLIFDANAEEIKNKDLDSTVTISELNLNHAEILKSETEFVKNNKTTYFYHNYIFEVSKK